METALSNDFGICIQCEDNRCAIGLRRNLYRIRDGERATGSDAFDSLSFLLCSNEIMIVKRNCLPKVHVPSYSVRPLSLNELPESVCVRGFAKPPLAGILMHSMMVEETQKAAKGLTQEELIKLIPKPNRRR